MATILSVNDPKALQRAAEIVHGGGLIAFPTDTVYGVGGDLAQSAAIAAIFALKGRQPDKALPVLLASAAQMAEVARDIPDAVWRLVEVFWPGALTLIVKRRHTVPDLVGGTSGTIGVRVPGHRGLLRLLETIRLPLASSSANLSGQGSGRNVIEVEQALGSGLQLILDGGEMPSRTASTVLDMSGDMPKILRLGSISGGDIARVIGQNPLLVTSRQET